MGNCCRKTKVIPDPQSSGSRVKNGGWKRKVAKRMKLAKFSSRVDIISTDDGSKVPETSTESNVKLDVTRNNRIYQTYSGTLRENDSTLALFFARQDDDEVNDVIRAETEVRNPSLNDANDEIIAEAVHSSRSVSKVTGGLAVTHTVSTRKADDCEGGITIRDSEKFSMSVNDENENDKREDDMEVPQERNFTQHVNNPYFSSKKCVHEDFNDFEGEIEEDICEEGSDAEDLSPRLVEKDLKIDAASVISENTIEKSGDDVNEMVNDDISMTGRDMSNTESSEIERHSEQAVETCKMFKRGNQEKVETPVLKSIGESASQTSRRIDPAKTDKILKAYLLYLKSLAEETTEQNSQTLEENEACKGNIATVKTPTKEDIKSRNVTQGDKNVKPRTTSKKTKGEHKTKKIKTVKRRKVRKTETSSVKTTREQTTENRRAVKAKEFHSTNTPAVITSNQETEIMGIVGRNKTYKGETSFEKIPKTRKTENIKPAKRHHTRKIKPIPVNAPKKDKTDKIRSENGHETCELDTSAEKTFLGQNIKNIERAKTDQTNKIDSGAINTVDTEDLEAPTRVEAQDTYAYPEETLQIQETENIEAAKSNKICRTLTTTEKPYRTKEIDDMAAKSPLEKSFTVPLTGDSKVVARNDIRKIESHSLEIARQQEDGFSEHIKNDDYLLTKPADGTAAQTVSVADCKDEQSGTNTKDEIKVISNISEPVVGTSQTIGNKCISTTDGTSKRPTSGFITKSEPSISIDGSLKSEKSFLKSTKSADTRLNVMNEELKRKISKTSEESLEKLGSHDGKADCLLNIFVHPADPDIDPKPVQVRAPTHMIRDGSAKTFLKNLEHSIVTTGVKNFDPLGKPKRTSKQHLKQSSSLVTSESNSVVHWTQKRGPVSDVHLTQVPKYYEPAPKKKNMREKLGLQVLQKFNIQVQCKQIERIKVNADLFPGILPPKMQEKLNRKMEARKPIN